MFTRPALFREFLSHKGWIKEFYDALAEEDTSKVAMTALQILRNTGTLPRVEKKCKSSEISKLHRLKGNAAYKCGHFQQALSHYNEALLFASKGSEEMKLAYSNRSALFLHLKVWSACCNDIKRVFSMGCPSNIKEKLTKRKNEAQPLVVKQQCARGVMIQVADEFIDRSKMKPNIDIPSVSSDIKIDTASAMPKAVAATNIDVGVVLTSERAYVSFTDESNSTVSCHFCQRKELNLIPCDGCCYALFCDEVCKQKCMEEYHEYECIILDTIRAVCRGPMINLMLKACLKLRKSCKSWEEFIAASQNMGNSRIKSSSSQEIFDTNNKYSVLCFNNDKTFVHGLLYQASFVVATVLHYLEHQIPSFLPSNVDKREQAKKALARVMMFVSVYQKPLIICQGQNNIRLDVSSYGKENYGLFPFISKLKLSCQPNTIVANNNNKLVLIALSPIKKGEDITVPYQWHKHDFISLNNKQRNIRLFLFHGTVCDCKGCSSDATEIDAEPLSEHQKKFFYQLDMELIESKLRKLEIYSVYNTLLKALTVLSDVPNSEEYIIIYKCWRRCVTFFEIVNSNNNILDHI